MASPLAGTFDGIGETVVAKPTVLATTRPKYNPLVLACCLLAWLGVGAFLSWLIGDFGIAYGSEHPVAIQCLIFFMFAMSALVVLMVRRSSFRAQKIG